VTRPVGQGQRRVLLVPGGASTVHGSFPSWPPPWAVQLTKARARLVSQQLLTWSTVVELSTSEQRPLPGCVGQVTADRQGVAPRGAHLYRMRLVEPRRDHDRPAGKGGARDHSDRPQLNMVRGAGGALWRWTL
jgi:hypothetical protein